MSNPEGLALTPLSVETQSRSFEVGFEFFWNKLSTGMVSLVGEERLHQLKQEALLKEYSFMAKVYTATMQAAAETSNKVICLFDIDGTIGELPEDDESADIHTLLRPSFPILVEQLTNELKQQVSFGLLSNRSQKSLDDEMEYPSFLSPVRALMNPLYAFSSGEQERSDLLNGVPTQQAINCYLDSIRGIIDSNVIDKTISGEIQFHDWYDTKINTIVGLHAKYPTTTLIVVDNFPYAACFNPVNERIRGICVREEEQQLLP